MNLLKMIGRDDELFVADILQREAELSEKVKSCGFLVIGGAGSIGQAVTKEIFRRDPKILHVVDISENNLVELVRDIRSSLGYGSGDFQTFALDCGSSEFEALVNYNSGHYDYILNLSALKHVRSESDPFTLMRMIRTNIFNTIHTLSTARTHGAAKYFCVSTDKAANPVNMMGASKRIMEMFMMRESKGLSVSMARFANVAFSDGSLLHGFEQRLLKRQPISAPYDVKRYFVSPKESGELCLLSTIFGGNLEIFFPKLTKALNLTTFSDIAAKYLEVRGYEPYLCESEEEARGRVDELSATGRWPCFFFESDTTGEKDFEEFYTETETLDFNRFNSIGVIENVADYDASKLLEFEEQYFSLLKNGAWTKADLVAMYDLVLPDFRHLETGKYLDQRM